MGELDEGHTAHRCRSLGLGERQAKRYCENAGGRPERETAEERGHGYIGQGEKEDQGGSDSCMCSFFSCFKAVTVLTRWDEQLGDVEDMLGSMLQEYHLAKQVKIPEALPPMSAGLTKTNWESEIKQRYTMPLSSESGEFPDIESIRLRMNPICYEEGIPGGCSPDAANFMNVAAETFVKEILSTIIGRVRSNGPNYIQTDKYRKLAPKRKWCPPVEKPLLGMHDVRLSLALGDNLLAQLPLSMKKIMAGGWYERDYEVGVDEQYVGQVDVEGWEGGAVDDRRQLRGLLDDCLTVGS